MNNQTPPPLPKGVSIQPGSHPQSSEAKEVYNVFEQKIGGVPNLRKRDNLYQGLCILGCLVIGAVVGLVAGGSLSGAGIGALIGTVGGLLLSGIVLMVIGWFRKA
jgi:hypothetical protein